MLSSLRSRGFFLASLLALPLLLSACRTAPNRGEVEEGYTGKIAELMPDGRVYPNDLSVGRHRFAVTGAWLFDSQILVQDGENEITALDRKSLEAKWAYMRLGAPLDFAPTMSPTSAVMIADGVLHEVDRWLGNQLHVFPLDFVPSAGAAATDSTAYIPSLAAAAGTNTLTTVNLTTGLEGWGLSTRDSIGCAPVIGGSATRPILYFVSEDGSVFAYPADSSVGGTPTPSWMTGTHGRNVSCPTLSDDLLLVGSDAGDLWAFDRVTGETAWVKMSGSPITASPWASGDQVYFRNPEGFFALSRAEGNELWSLKTPCDFLVRRPDAVYVSMGEGLVQALDPQSGEVLRSVRFPRETIFLANQMDGVFYVVSPDGYVFAVDLPIR